MDVVVVMAAFFIGLVLAFQGFVGKEVNPDGQPFAIPLTLRIPALRIHPNATDFGCSSSASL